MSMSEITQLDLQVGTVVKVIHVNEEEDTIYFRFPDGKSGWATVPTGKVPEQNALIFINENGWRYAPEEIWFEVRMVAVVLLVIGQDVLVELGSTTRSVRNRIGIDVAVGNTIEYNDIDGVLRVVSATPIRSGGMSVDLEDVRKQYLIPTTGAGPTFDEFGGYPGVKARARELIETQLERRKQLDEIRARPVKGILFTGPPGTGKTHLARIIAHESKADFFLVSGPSIVSKWLGDTEDTLRKIFEAATKSRTGKAIIFFDEIDSIAERRSGDSHEASKRLIAQLLTEMDGFDDSGKSVIVIAATNRVEVLDPALTRPGRFDWEIAFGMPTLSDRFEILRVHAQGLTTWGELPLEDLAVLTEGWSAAELTSIWTEAALVAAGDNRGRISAEDVAQAFERVASRPRRSPISEDPS